MRSKPSKRLGEPLIYNRFNSTLYMKEGSDIRKFVCWKPNYHMLFVVEYIFQLRLKLEVEQ